jgi:hypothetical protein
MQPFIHPVHNIPVYLGKKDKVVDKRTLQFAKYSAALPPASSMRSYIQKVLTWPMFLNDTLGCCVPAGEGHNIIQETTYAGKSIVPTDADILKAYSAIGGYVPGDPSTDNGCDMLTACKYYVNTGIAGRKIVAFVELNPKKPQELMQAVSLFGSAYLGIALPVSAQSQVGSLWAVPQTGLTGNGAPGSWGGHCVPLYQYNTALNTELITWGAVQRMSWKFITAYVDEAYALVTQDWIEADGKSPSGLDVATLQADLKLVQAS